MARAHAAILGTGLLGTSVALALRRASPTITVTGYDGHAESLSQALARGGLTATADSPAEAVRDADVVVVATPVVAMRDVFRAIAPALCPGTLMTDVGSTKQQVLRWAADCLPPGVDFVGGHPMAGKVASGPLAADAALFEGAVWCIVAGERTRTSATAELAALVRSFGAQPRPIEAEVHDALVAQVSHVPYLLAVACMSQAACQPTWPLAAEMAATGFGYATNLAGKDPRMYADIMLTNRDSVLHTLDRVAAELGELRAAIAAEDAPRLLAAFTRAQSQRDAWLQGKPAVRRVLGPAGPSTTTD